MSTGTKDNLVVNLLPLGICGGGRLIKNLTLKNEVLLRSILDLDKFEKMKIKVVKI